MSDHTTLKEYDHLEYGADSPVVLENQKICYHSLYGVNVLQLTFRNVSGEHLYELGIHIEAYDKNDQLILDEPLEYNYYGIEVENGELFGEKDDIVIETEAVRFEITVIRAELTYGRMFRGDVVLREMPEPQDISALGEFTKEFKDRYKKIYPSIPIVCAPEKKDYYWRCTCGYVFPHSMKKCPVCGVEHDKIFGIIEELEEEKRQRLEYEAEQERLRLEEEARIAAEEEAARLEAERLEQQRIEMERLAEEKARQIAEENEKRRLEEQALKNAKKKKLRILLGSLAAVLLLVLVGVKLVPSLLKDDEKMVASEEEPVEKEPEKEEEPEPEPEPEPPVQEENYGKSVAVIGENLTGEDRRLVLRLIGMDENAFQDYVVVTVTNAQEHQYLDAQLGAAKIGTQSLSCLLITPTAPGTGITISMYNINYCTEEMYRQALNSVGITDATVYVAAPYASTGTSALTGIYLTPQYMEAPAEETADEQAAE